MGHSKLGLSWRRSGIRPIVAGLGSALAMALLVPACASPQDTESPMAGPRSDKAMPAPTRADVAKQITAAENGATVNVATGTTISIALKGIPTAGYVWSVTATPSFLEAAGEDGGPTNQAQLQPGFTGGRHWEVFYFRVIGEGEGIVRLEQRRPWEEDEAPADEFSVTIISTAG